MTKSDNGKNETITTKQIQAIPLIAIGLTDDAVAEKVGVARQTINQWRNHNEATSGIVCKLS
jgi:hypothetical protein